MQAPQQIDTIFDKQFSSLNNSSLIVACCMVIMNLSAKYLPLDINSEIDEFLQSSVMRKVVVFAILYLATRKFVYALFGTIIFYIITRIILNRDSKLNLLQLRSKPTKTNNLKLNKDDINLVSEILEKTKLDDNVVKSMYDRKVDELILKLRKTNLK